MFTKTKNHDPIVVVVTESDWYALGDPTSYRAHRLFQTLKLSGGVNESVPPGTYHFNVIRRGFKFVASLESISE